LLTHYYLTLEHRKCGQFGLQKEMPFTSPAAAGRSGDELRTI
jgi:hypothetical protein